MNTLKDVKARTRALIGDPDADFSTDAYLVPLINQAYEQMINYLSNTCSPFMTKLVVVLGIPKGTTDLTEFQVTGKPLDGLMNPLGIEFKVAGQPENFYCPATRQDILPNITPTGNPPTRNMYWEWRSYLLYVTPLPYDSDLRVRGEFRPAPLLEDNNIIAIHPLMAGALAYATAALIGGERMNASYVQNWQQQATLTLDDISAELVRQQQGTSTRIGRMNQSHRRRGYY